MRRFAPALALAAAALVGLPGGAAAADRCAGPDRETMVETSEVRVYRVTRGKNEMRVYACLRSTGRRMWLWFHGDDGLELDFVAPIRIAGTVVAYGIGTLGREHNQGTAVTARDVRTGRTVFAHRELNGTTIKDLELTAGSSVAWIAEDREGRHPVRRRDATGIVTLDDGAGVDPESLTVSGSEFRWTKDGEPRTATVTDGPGCKVGQRAVVKLRSDRVRVYKLRGGPKTGTVYACSYATGARVRLGTEGRYFPDTDLLAPVRIVGDLVAYGRSCICRTSHGAVVGVVGTNPRRRLVNEFDPGWYRITDLELRADGAVAAIAARQAGGFEVWKRDAAGEAVLDSAPGIEPESLELDGSTLSWIHDGQRREHALAATR